MLRTLALILLAGCSSVTGPQPIIQGAYWTRHSDEVIRLDLGANTFQTTRRLYDPNRPNEIVGKLVVTGEWYEEDGAICVELTEADLCGASQDGDTIVDDPGVFGWPGVTWRPFS